MREMQSHQSSYLVTGATFERCQHAGDMRAFQGEAGNGVYAYPSRHRGRLRLYYTSQGESVYSLRMGAGDAIVDLTSRHVMPRLLEYARSFFAQREADIVNFPSYRKPRVTASSIQRYGSVIESFVRENFPDVVGWIVLHAGPGIPTGKQVVITDISRFSVELILPAAGTENDDAFPVDSVFPSSQFNR